ncbi:type II toxin-antitoxin system death-on-curing family toxin [Rhodoferax sp.]|uniref:type II toxin-antitoxin system death-on-curing family toxin n=1 Tax=Rhodoferax sp. TaxID=50421 RepID=UPI00262BF962|nr:type II toxin-antitoxin system death-on-curing family toxin [Rhodoferax sp.]MDD2926736.1 type II toxin-antitoxin system death-on-curing family toxin [Rhodoferax sp.]
MSAERQTWAWLEPALIHAVHEEQLAEHGGGTGLRDANLLGSALGRPEQLACYGTPDVADLAAAYGYGISRNHPFIDGNKRTAFVATELFLALNGFDLLANDVECVMTMLSVAAGEIEEAAFAQWIRQHIQAR